MMKAISSPLAVVELEDVDHLSFWKSIGIAADLYLNHSSYGQNSIDQFVQRIIPALQEKQAQVFFDDESRPYGFASWAIVGEKSHSELLQHGQLPQVWHEDSPHQHLWFIDILSPFCSPLEMIKRCKQSLSSFDQAFALQPNLHSGTARKIW